MVWRVWRAGVPLYLVLSGSWGWSSCPLSSMRYREKMTTQNTALPSTVICRLSFIVTAGRAPCQPSSTAPLQPLSLSVRPVPAPPALTCSGSTGHTTVTAQTFPSIEQANGQRSPSVHRCGRWKTLTPAALSQSAHVPRPHSPLPPARAPQLSD